MKKRLKPPPGCRDVTDQYVGKILCLIPAEMRDGKLDPGSYTEINDGDDFDEILRKLHIAPDDAGG
jgi:hypothetical protein